MIGRRTKTNTNFEKVWILPHQKKYIGSKINKNRQLSLNNFRSKLLHAKKALKIHNNEYASLFNYLHRLADKFLRHVCAGRGAGIHSLLHVQSPYNDPTMNAFESLFRGKDEWTDKEDVGGNAPHNINTFNQQYRKTNPPAGKPLQQIHHLILDHHLPILSPKNQLLHYSYTPITQFLLSVNFTTTIRNQYSVVHTLIKIHNFSEFHIITQNSKLAKAIKA